MYNFFYHFQSALGAVILKLKEALIDNLIMEQKQVKTIDPPLERMSVQDEGNGQPQGSRMILDNKTLQHLDILPNPDHPDVLSLFQVIDKTYTPMGKRLLRQYICMPLLQVQEIIGNVQLFVKLTFSFCTLGGASKLFVYKHHSGAKINLLSGNHQEFDV